MHASLIKETRSLLPAFAVILRSISVHFAIWCWVAADFATCVFVIGCVLMGAIPFGAEFQYRTLPLLLVQPVPRSSFWREKLLVSGAGMTLSWLAYLVSEG